MDFPKTDNCCTRMGWIEKMVWVGGYELHVSHKPDADLNDSVWCFDHAEQEMIIVSGWLGEWEEIIEYNEGLLTLLRIDLEV